jgi:hypothetical protein
VCGGFKGDGGGVYYIILYFIIFVYMHTHTHMTGLRGLKEANIDYVIL